MTTHVMIDFETLDVKPTAVILSVGAVLFNPRGNGIISRLEIRPTIDEQTEVYNRTISESTVKWWESQSPEAIERAMGDEGRIPFRDCMEQLAKFCWNADGVWANGATFDIPMVESSWDQLDIRIPYPFWSIRDCRTMYETAGVSLKDDGYVTSHIAVEDAERQAFFVQRANQNMITAGLPGIK